MMNQKDALKIGQSAVGQPSGHGTSWVIYSPYYADQPNGPSSQTNFDSYSKAAAARPRMVAHVALAAMGIRSDDARYAIEESVGTRMTAAQILSGAVRAS